MDTKLTIKLNKLIIERAKKYASERNISLSRMIENYLRTITSKNDEETKISPLVESLTGVIKEPDTDYKREYSDFLTKKYK